MNAEVSSLNISAKCVGQFSIFDSRSECCLMKIILTQKVYAVLAYYMPFLIANESYECVGIMKDIGARRSFHPRLNRFDIRRYKVQKL